MAVRAAPASGPLERLLHLASECRQIVWGGREHPPSEQSLPRETIAQAPEDCMAHVGLEAIEGQEDAPAGRREALEAGRLLPREGHPCVVTLQEMDDRPWGYGHAALDQRLRDVRDTPVVAVALRSNEGHASKAPCLLRECQVPLLFRPIWLATLRTSRVEAAPELERESQDRGQGGDGTVVMVRGPHRLTTRGARALERLQSLRFGGARSRRSTCHSRYLHESLSAWYRYHLPPTFAHFAILVFFNSLITVVGLTCNTRAVSRMPLAFMAISTICCLTSDD